MATVITRGLVEIKRSAQDIKDIAAMNAIWDAWVPAGHAPPRATVQAMLARPELLVEVVVSAALA